MVILKKCLFSYPSMQIRCPSVFLPTDENTDYYWYSMYAHGGNGWGEDMWWDDNFRPPRRPSCYCLDQEGNLYPAANNATDENIDCTPPPPTTTTTTTAPGLIVRLANANADILVLSCSHLPNLNFSQLREIWS